MRSGWLLSFDQRFNNAAEDVEYIDCYVGLCRKIIPDYCLGIEGIRIVPGEDEG